MQQDLSKDKKLKSEEVRKSIPDREPERADKSSMTGDKSKNDGSCGCG